MKDDNERILELIQERLAIGEERYGHGVRKNDDTTQWGTKTDSWTEMGLEEALDLTIYLSAQLLRLLDKEAEQERLNAIRVKFALEQAEKIRNLEARLEKFEVHNELLEKMRQRYEEKFGTEISDSFPLL
tara:strand:- start:1045 stop:1434 length:390 start_codon:yes stop_codon:yes gene_type:complete